MKAVIDAEESERKRIAEDLHDGIGQTLSGLKLACAGIAERLHSSEGRDALGRLTHSLDEACSEVRTLSHRMRPKALNELGLIPAIEDMLSRSLGHSDISYTFDHYGLGKRPGEAVEVALYRILQELVNNIIRHSQATEASVQLYRNNQWIVLVVEENGVGFEYDAVKGRGIGLLNIQSRVEAVGGEVHYETTPGSGTVVTIRLKA